MVKGAYMPDRGDLVWLDFEPTRGREQKGSRPALVVSPKAYNVKVGLLLACSITSHSKGYPFEVMVERSGLKGAILADHVRSLDWKARRVKYIAKVPAQVTNAVEEKLLLLVKS